MSPIPIHPGRHLLIRHAESAANAEQTTTDPAGIRLTPEGRASAVRFAQEYDGPTPSLIAFSPYIRARETAAPFVQMFSGVRLEEWPVHEFTYLDPARCGTSTAPERRPLVEAYWTRATAGFEDGPGAESFAGFLQRVGEAMDRLAGLEERAVVFTHEMVMKAFLWLAGDPAERTPQAFAAFMREFTIPNPGVMPWPLEPAPVPREIDVGQEVDRFFDESSRSGPEGPTADINTHWLIEACQPPIHEDPVP